LLAPSARFHNRKSAPVSATTSVSDLLDTRTN
jgi:hypothetical protein